MGLNHYLRTKACEKCGHRKEELHIGKSSMGWQYHFEGYIEQSIVSLEDWMNEFKDENKEIVDENGEVIDKDDFLSMIYLKKLNDNINLYNVTVGQPQTEKEKKYCKERHNYCGHSSDFKCWIDKDGYVFTQGKFS